MEALVQEEKILWKSFLASFILTLGCIAILQTSFFLWFFNPSKWTKLQMFLLLLFLFLLLSFTKLSIRLFLTVKCLGLEIVHFETDCYVFQICLKLSSTHLPFLSHVSTWSKQNKMIIHKSFAISFVMTFSFSFIFYAL